MYRKIRISLATIFFLGVVLLFLDFTGSAHAWLAWMSTMQFVPAVLSANLVVVGIILLLTLIFGRAYCSIICPLGVWFDIVGWAGLKVKKNRYTYSPALKWLRIAMLVLFIIGILAGISSVVVLLDPYSTFGLFMAELFAPIYYIVNNLLAQLAERMGSYMIYETDVWLRSIVALATAVTLFVILGILAWRNGRTYCNTICPVGTVLGYLSQFSLLAPVIDTNKCNGCTRCARNCKSSCIDAKNHTIDYTRCVVCMDCIDNCSQNAIQYRRRCNKKCTTEYSVDNSRRKFLSLGAIVAAIPIVNAQAKVDGGLAVIEDKKIPQRTHRIIPPGAGDVHSFERRCTACQLCVVACPNEVLRPSQQLDSLLQPHLSYERGYCRPECVKCAEVCPTDAIKLIDIAEKSSIQIGHAVWVKENCIAHNRGVKCNNCERHCPVGAIQMITPDGGNGTPIPSVDTERCIGCGACENLCPARPFSALYVEGHKQHRIV